MIDERRRRLVPALCLALMGLLGEGCAAHFLSTAGASDRTERAATHPSEADARLSCGGAPCVQTEVTRRVTRERGTGWFWGVAAAEMVVGVGSASTR